MKPIKSSFETYSGIEFAVWDDEETIPKNEWLDVVAGRFSIDGASYVLTVEDIDRLAEILRILRAKLAHEEQ